MTTGKKWMLGYSILFIILSILFVKNDISNHYNLIYIVWMSLNYTLINFGNFLFVTSKELNKISKVWKILFPVFLINLIVSIIIDQKFGENSSPEDSIFLNLFAFTAIVALFFPAFRANFKIAYRQTNKVE